MSTQRLTNWDGYEVKSPPTEYRTDEGSWFISDAEIEVSVSSGCDYGDRGITSWGSGPWSEAKAKSHQSEPSASLTATLVDNDGEEIREIKLTGQAAIDFIGWEEIESRAEEAHACGEDYDEEPECDRYDCGCFMDEDD
jgi:hypothetical protein